jgi:hypothetical protein
LGQVEHQKELHVPAGVFFHQLNYLRLESGLFSDIFVFVNCQYTKNLSDKVIVDQVHSRLRDNLRKYGFRYFLSFHIRESAVQLNTNEKGTQLNNICMMQVDCFVFEKIKYFIREQLITISVIGACKNLNIFRKHVNFPELDSSVG